jgi:alpha-L-rhamnosidase
MKNLIFLYVISVFLFASCTEKKTFKQPQKLQTKYQASPIGIDVATPRFSWQLNDTARGAEQTAYQLIVSSSMRLLKKGVGDIWDSEKVESDQSLHVKYNGPALESRKIYFWKVKTWDQDRNESSWSKPASWEMGLLKREDWQARWVGLDVEPDRSELEKYGNWIWHPDEKGLNIPIYFRKSFTLPEGRTVRKAMLGVTADNEFEAWVNGAGKGRGDDWQRIFSMDITNDLHEGENILAYTAMTTQPEYCGLIFYLDLVYADGTNEYISSGAGCKVSLKPSGSWKKAGYNDESWINAEIIAPYGGGYWGYIDAPGPVPRSTLIRKEFTAAKQVKKARAYVTGLGNYELYINGEKIGNDLLTPGWTDYHNRVQYQAYDITDHVQTGENAAGMFLGNMWWSSGLGWMGGRKYSNGPVRGLYQIELEYRDGSTEIIATDETWMGHVSPITDNSIYQGEKYDARLEIDGWSQPGLNQEGWESVTLYTEEDTLILSAQAGPPIRIAQEITPVSVTEVEPGKFVYDMGINLVGFARLNVQGEAGTEVTLRFAELLHDDGTVAQENLRSAKATDKYILKGGEPETWQPRFTYHGFRYV